MTRPPPPEDPPPPPWAGWFRLDRWAVWREVVGGDSLAQAWSRLLTAAEDLKGIGNRGQFAVLPGGISPDHSTRVNGAGGKRRKRP
jgi:hypothetical protein